MDDKTCLSIGCHQPAKLQCPKCIKLNIEGSYFCSQECFKKNWVNHKYIHKQTDKADPFIGYRYTGDLRAAYPLLSRREVADNIQQPDYAATSYPRIEKESKYQREIRVYNDEEIEEIRKVCKIAREVLDIGAAAIRPGITTEEIDNIVHEATIERGAYPSPLNYMGFPKSVCTSVNEVICHGIPDRRPLEEGDIVNLDVTCYLNGYHGDLNATYAVGKIDAESKKLINTARECLEKAIAIVKPGTPYREFGKIIEEHAKRQGFSVVRTYSGHGIGELFHCAPNVPHYANNKAIGVCRPGHVFTIEPMINQGTWRDVLWPDNWTSATEDGKRSAQFEQTLLVTEDGVEILTK